MFRRMIETVRRPPLIRVEFKNRAPVDLIDLAASLRAFGEAYTDFVHDDGWDVSPGNVRLLVHKIESGSIIGELAPYADQANWVLEQAKTLLPFVKTFDSMTKYLLGSAPRSEDEGVIEPTRQQAEQLHTILEPTAKDRGSQLNIGVLNFHGPVTFNTVVTSQEANAAQNGAKRLMGPALPASQILTDQVLILRQVRGDGSLTTGDRGIIEGLSPKHLKLNFSTPAAKQAILNAPYGQFETAFLVDVEVKAIDGKPALYRILEVKDSFEKPT